MKYQKTLHFGESYFTQEYTLLKKSENFGYEEFKGTFLKTLLADPWIDGEGFKDGVYERFDKDNQLVKFGKYYKEDKEGTWINYYNEQGVQIETEFISNKPSIEKYIEIKSKSPYSGKFELIDADNNVKEIRNVKNGLRHGKTMVYNLETGEVIRKDKYKYGILR